MIDFPTSTNISTQNHKIKIRHQQIQFIANSDNTVFIVPLYAIDVELLACLFWCWIEQNRSLDEMGIFSTAHWMLTFTNSFLVMNDVSKCHTYSPPDWWTGDKAKFPKNGRLRLSNLPTPIHLFTHDKLDFPFNLIVKRDDMTGGIELSGNKVRKLEFLLADALTRGFDSVVTIGGEQSNHCRATTAAARMVGLSSALVLRTRKADDNLALALTGNLLVSRMVGTTVYTCTPGEYGRFGYRALLDLACEDMRSHGLSPYAIPVGGSNELGTWGYIEAVNELYQQIDDIGNTTCKVDHIVFACGSGGTAAGISLGVAVLALSKADEYHTPQVHAIGVCDDPDFFYNKIFEIGLEMGLFFDITKDEANDWVRSILVVHQGKGKGYAVSTKEELKFCTSFSMKTGIVLDPVYTGKAMYHFVNNIVQNDPMSFEGKNILFWHTGGSLGMFDKEDALIDDLLKISPVIRMLPYTQINK